MLSSLVACGHTNTPAAAPCDRPPPLDPLPKLAADLPLPSGSEVTAVKQKKGFVSVDAIASSTIDAAYRELAGIMQAEGFAILNAENEGTDAEVYFARYADVAGVVRLKLGPCPGTISVGVIYDPLEDPNANGLSGKRKKNG